MNVIAKLDKKSRDALPDDMFAVPRLRKLLLTDDRHTAMAWKDLDNTQGLTDDEHKTARERILARAAELGITLKDRQHRIESGRWLSIDAMALNIANDDDHPNKMPFSGVLTKLDEPSDFAPGGAAGKRIIVTSEAAQKALESLLGMAVDFTPHFDGHDAQKKIGIISSAEIVGNEIRIAGFVYAADFPETAELIQALKDVLGFSFEAQRLYVEDPSADILRITELTFTGAAILRKDKAAYQTTSLAASAEGEIEMTAEELKALLGPMLAEAIKPVTDRLEQVEKDNKAVADTLAASASVRAMVEPHATALEGCAAAMEAAGVGNDPKWGHVHVLRRMSDSMRAEAALGKVPHIWRDHDYPTYASAETNEDEIDMTKDEVSKLIASAVETAVKPLTEQLKAAEDKLAAAETKLADVKASARKESPAPERKSVNPMISKLLAGTTIAMPEGEEKLAVASVDSALKAAGLDVAKRLMVKNELTRIGAL
jgi:hypothetical protein